MIKREKIEGSNFRQILTALITSDAFVEEFAQHYKADFFEASFARIICQWCLDFYKKFDEAIKSHIIEYKDNLVRDININPDELKLIEDLLESLNEDYEDNEVCVKYLMEQVNNLQAKQDIQFLKNELETAIEKNDTKTATELIEEFQTGGDSGEEFDDDPDNFLTDDEVEDAIFTTRKDPLFKYPGAYGQMINNALIPNSLVSIRMPPNCGKTWHLTDIVVRACMARKNVAYFQTGDLSKGQTYERLALNMCGIPRRPLKPDHKKPVIDCHYNQDNSCTLFCREGLGKCLDENGDMLSDDKIPKTYKPCNRCHIKGIKVPLTTFNVPDYSEEVMTPDIVKKWRNIFKSRMRGRKLFSKVYTNDILTFAKIEQLLKKWKQKYNFDMDGGVLIVDYEELMKAEPGTERDEKDVMNKRYKKARQLGQKFNCCVVLAEQKKLDELDSNIGTMKGFVGSSSKNKHITDGFSFVRLKDDKKKKVLRVNAFKRRDEEFDEQDQVVILQDLNRGMFYVDSYWARDEYRKPEPEPDKKKKQYRKY